MVAIWASEASKQYDAVSFVGSGCFSSVWVAKPKERKPCLLHPNKDDEAPTCNCDHVAMKSTVIVQREDPERAYKYAKQEVQILLQLDHPHIVKVVQQFALETSAVYSVALKLAPGPTLEHLVEYGGALGVPLAQCMAKQLISALAYMHSRGVIHRDLKPDNVIVTGASFSEDAVWCDEQENPQVQALLSKCHITVVDFGFAKVLTPQDVRKPPPNSTDNDRTKKVKKTSINNALNEKRPKRRTDIGVAVDSSISDTSNTSISKHQCLNLTALGNKHYCAPEVLQTLRALSEEANSAPSTNSKEQPPTPKPQEVHSTKNVANYGMNADSFSCGALLRYVLTGVPPEYKIEEYIARQQNVVALIANYLFFCCSKNKNTNASGETRKQRTPRLKRSYEIPEDASNLIQSLTKRSAQDRETIRNVQCHPWIQLKETNDPTIHEPLRFLVLDP